MLEPWQRLKQARKNAGYATASEAAAAMGVKEPTYIHHENGTNGLSRSAARYAKFFRVSIDWLLTGKGEPVSVPSPTIPMVGTVGAGAVVFPAQHDTAAHAIEYLDAIGAEKLAAVEVRGDSQYPRFLANETIIFDREPSPPERLIGKYAIVDCSDGRRLVKIIQKGTSKHRFRLESHNAPPEDDIEVERAYIVRAILLG